MRMIFVNLPVKNVEASKQFFAALGFSHNKQFSSERSAAIVISDAIVVMLLDEPHFKEFIPGQISDATKAKEVLLAFSCDSRKEVEELTAKAFAAGAKPFMPAQDLGFMYGTSFEDLDGHVWEPMWMDPKAVQPA